MANRNSLSLKVEILQMASQKGGTKKTHLIQHVGFSSAQLNKHLNDLMRGEYLRKDGDCYVETDKGADFLREYHRLVSQGFGDILEYDNNGNGKEHLLVSRVLPAKVMTVYH